MAYAGGRSSGDIEIRDLAVAYRRRRAVDGLGLRVGPGVTALLGPNGAGKSTVLRVVATVLAPDQGSVSVAGHDLSCRTGRREARRCTGYLPQSIAHHPRMTVRESVSYALWLKGIARARWEELTVAAAHEVGLGGHLDARVRSLSGGMQRRAAIARAIAHRPSVLLLDEPTAGLDPGQRAAFHSIVAALGRTTTVVLSTHLLSDVAAVAAHAAVLVGGRLRWQGSRTALAAMGAGDDLVTRLETAYQLLCG